MRKILIWLNLANLGDAIITFIGINTFGNVIEANTWFHDNPGPLLFWKVLSVLVLSLFVYREHKRQTEGIKTLLECMVLILVLVLTLVVLWNLIIFLTY